MLDGGPALSYIDKLRHDPKNAILLTGYQVEGTNGRRLMDTGKMVFDGEEKEINCEVAFFDFSAHADHKQLLRFVDKCEPTKVVLMHGDQREVLAKDLEGYRVVIPNEGDRIEV
jgi:putative mRNA 3-end processing factor